MPVPQTGHFNFSSSAIARSEILHRTGSNEPAV
jgi:hypothetical protein